MLIANPIYDTVFKYLFEDEPIARGLLSELLAEEVSSVEFRSQELISEARTSQLGIFRFDFLALIRTAQGARKVLIEMQKARSVFDIERFRLYLAEHYRRRDRLSGQAEEEVLPIITIYFLGFTLGIDRAVIKVQRQYIDGVTGEAVNSPKEDFLELLTHDSYSVQIPRLSAGPRNRLEALLEIFRQDRLTSDPHEIDYQGDQDDPLTQRMVQRLQRAAASIELRRQMDAEDELERIYKKELKGLKERLEEKEQQLEEKEQQLEEKEQLLEEKVAESERRAAALSALEHELDMLRKRLE